MTSQGEALVAYRLGRLEKAVEQINTLSIARDDKILVELGKVGEISQKVSQNTWRINSLESSRTSIYRFLSGLASAILILGAQVIFKLF